MGGLDSVPLSFLRPRCRFPDACLEKDPAAFAAVTRVGWRDCWSRPVRRFLWLAFTLLMLARLNRAQPRALRRVRKADRVKARRRVQPGVSEGTGVARRHP